MPATIDTYRLRVIERALALEVKTGMKHSRNAAAKSEDCEGDSREGRM